MERATKAVAITLLLLVMTNALVEKSEAKFSPGCFIKCMVLCVPFKNPFMCGADCGLKCLITPVDVSNPEAWKDETSSFCQLGCAMSACTSLITKENQGTEKMEKCVGTCETTCN